MVLDKQKRALVLLRAHTPVSHSASPTTATTTATTLSTLCRHARLLLSLEQRRPHRPRLTLVGDGPVKAHVSCLAVHAQPTPAGTPGAKRQARAAPGLWATTCVRGRRAFQHGPVVVEHGVHGARRIAAAAGAATRAGVGHH